MVVDFEKYPDAHSVEVQPTGNQDHRRSTLDWLNTRVSKSTNDILFELLPPGESQVTLLKTLRVYANKTLS